MNLQEYITKGVDYKTYYEQIDYVIHNEKDAINYEYYGLNMQRIKRLQKKVELTEEQNSVLTKLHKKITFLVITEGWCGDAAQIIPVLEKIDNASENIETKMVYRDQNLELMNAYLTNGGMSIPIVIGVDENGEELFRWGPRPAFGTELLKQYKSGDLTKEEFNVNLQKAYNKDKGQTIIKEIFKLNRMKYIVLSIFSLFFLITSCDKKSQSETKTDTKVAAVTDVEEDENSNETDVPKVVEEVKEISKDVPSYMNIELEGVGFPNANLADFYGEVIFVNFWGTWCPPCRREMPSIQSLYEKYDGKVKFVTVAFEKRPGNLEPFIQKNNYTFPVYIAKSPLEPKMKARGYPTTFIIDKKGKIKAKDVGAADWNAPSVHKFLDKLLTE